jgi:hypothetical protein
MKKIFLNAALGCLALSPAIAVAQSSASNSGTLAVTVNDYITMVPGTGFAAGPVVFNNPAQMTTPVIYNNQVTIVASRAWKFDYSATAFTRTGPGVAGPGVATTIPAGNIWMIATDNGSAGVNTYLGVYQPSSAAPVNMANEATGTLTSTFDLSGKLLPGLTNQMSGTYNTSITQIASLN